MDRHVTARRAEQLLGGNQLAEAVLLYRQLCAETHVPDAEYDDWLRKMSRALVGLRRNRAAAYVHLYLLEFENALGLLGTEHLLDSARVLEQQDRQVPAAEHYQQQGKMMLAAVAFEKGGQDDRARACWLRSLEGLRAGAYERALVYFNLGYCCLRHEDEAGAGHLVTSQRLLEEAADDFETRGQRERAFDCYQILLEMGRRSGVFENLAEGYLNCIRILKEDGLKFYVLQYYEDFLGEATKRLEFHAAASLYREAADYCLRSDLLYERYYLRSAAETWMKAAAQHVEAGAAPELAENALLAAVECFNTMGDYHGVGRAYIALGGLSLATRKQERYVKIATRYDGIKPVEQEGTAFPEYLRHTHAYPEIWFHDLVELEHDGDVEAVCAQVVGDKNYPDVVRRRALTQILSVLEDHTEHESVRLARLAEGLGDLQIYVVLRPLEKLYEQPDPGVQRGVMRALRFLFFKRTFGLLREGLASEDNVVRKEAIEALGRLHFRHAFDPLVRIFREHEAAQVRSTALRSIGQIPSLEAGDFLIEVLRHEPEPLHTEAKQLLMRFDNRELYPILRQHYQMETGSLRQDLGDILQQFGGI